MIVEALVHAETISLDADTLERLYCQLGTQAAENVVSRALDELAIRLSDLAPLLRADRMEELSHLAHSIVAIGDQIGLNSLARVANDVSLCAQRGDRIALAATLCRLERIGDCSLIAIWDLDGQSV